MWYYTSHKLIIEDVPNSKDKTNEEIFEEIKLNDSMGYCFSEWLWEIGEKVKWYDLEKEMLEFSKQYPNKVFKLYWEWEEQWDIWQEFFVNGKSKREVAEIQVKEIDVMSLIS